MDNEQRRTTLRTLTDEQYQDIMDVVAIYPHITMKVTCEGKRKSMRRKRFLINLMFLVFDDENQHEITTGAVVTLNVHLDRANMSDLFSKQINGNIIENEINDEHVEEKEKVLTHSLLAFFLLY